MVFNKYVVGNNATGLLLTSVSTIQTTITLQLGHGAKFPNMSGGDKGVFTLTALDEEGVIIKQERVLVTAKSGDAFTVTRGFGGDTQQTFSAGDMLSILVTADVIEDIQDYLSDLTSITDGLDMAKLDAIGELRTGLNANKLLITDSDGNETELAFGDAGKVLQGNGSGSTPSRESPTVNINPLTEKYYVHNDDMYIICDSENGNINKKVKSKNTVVFSTGNGSDGNVTISANTTLTRNMYYNNLTINSGVVLNPNGFVIYVAGTLTNSGTIRRNGNNGGAGGNATSGNTSTAGAGAVALNSGLLGMTVPGANGGEGGYSTGAGGNGATGNSNNPTIITGNGGNGGNGVGSAGLGGSGGTSSKLFQIINYNLLLTVLTIPAISTIKNSGEAGGGGGGGSTTTDYYSVGHRGSGGGGGGGCGGPIVIFCNALNNTGTIESNGGNGGNGGNGPGGRRGAGGGGGCGGLVVIGIKNGNDSGIGTVTVTGGAGGYNGGTKTGTDGSPGVTIYL